MQELLRDLRYAARSLVRDKAFSLTVIATLAVCIAANSATFAIVSSILLRPLPVPESESILLMANHYPGAGAGDSTMSAAGDYYDRLRDVSAFEEQAMFNMGGRTVEIAGVPQRIEGMSATPSLFRLLRVQPALGRSFTDEEGEIGDERRVILSHGLWQQLYAGDSDAIGGEIRLNGEAHTIVGVMPADFTFVDPDIRLWTPLAFTREQNQTHHSSNNWYNVGRLKSGATLEQAQAQVDALNAANLERFPQFREILINARFHTVVMPLQEMLVGDVKNILFLLWGGALFVLFIGGLNVANLALVRLTLRSKELATRQALGAAGAQVVRQFVLENVLAALAGGVAGVGLGAGLLWALQTFGLDQLPRANEIRMDSTVVLVALAMAGLVGLLIGCAPLAQAFRANLSRALQEDGRSGTGGRRSNRLRQTIVAAQIAFAFVLLIGAGLLLASFRRLLEVDPGFTSQGVLTASASASGPSYDEAGRRALMRRSLQALRGIPGVRAAGATTTIPFGNNHSDSVIFAEGYEMKPGESVISPRQIIATPGYFQAMDIPIVKGRAFDDRDGDKATPAVIVDERLAERFWPDQDPIGRRMWQPQNPNDALAVDENTRWITVVGVVRSVRLDDFAGTGSPMGAYYFPYAQQPWPSFTFAIKAAGDPEAVSGAVRQEMARVDPQLALFDVRTMTQRGELSLSSERTAMTLAAGFGGVALFLSAIGIYGLLAYSVTQRRREIGIRMALGSTSANVISLVLREGLALAAAGLAVGVGGAVALRGIISNEIYGVSALDPLVIGAAALLLAAVVAAASAIPARRASRIHPVRALNQA